MWNFLKLPFKIQIMISYLNLLRIPSTFDFNKWNIVSYFVRYYRRTQPLRLIFKNNDVSTSDKNFCGWFYIFWNENQILLFFCWGCMHPQVFGIWFETAWNRQNIGSNFGQIVLSQFFKYLSVVHKYSLNVSISVPHYFFCTFTWTT